MKQEDQRESAVPKGTFGDTEAEDARPCEVHQSEPGSDEAEAGHSDGEAQASSVEHAETEDTRPCEAHEAASGSDGPEAGHADAQSSVDADAQSSVDADARSSVDVDAQSSMAGEAPADRSAAVAEEGNDAADRSPFDVASIANAMKAMLDARSEQPLEVERGTDEVGSRDGVPTDTQEPAAVGEGTGTSTEAGDVEARDVEEAAASGPETAGADAGAEGDSGSSGADLPAAGSEGSDAQAAAETAGRPDSAALAEDKWFIPVNAQSQAQAGPLGSLAPAETSGELRVGRPAVRGTVVATWTLLGVAAAVAIIVLANPDFLESPPSAAPYTWATPSETRAAEELAAPGIDPSGAVQIASMRDSTEEGSPAEEAEQGGAEARKRRTKARRGRHSQDVRGWRRVLGMGAGAERSHASEPPKGAEIPLGDQPAPSIEKLVSQEVMEAAQIGPLPETPSRKDVVKALAKVSGAVRVCAAGRNGVAEVDLTIASSGQVSNAVVGGDFAGTPQGSCIARAVRQARFGPFARPAFRIIYPFAL